MKRALAFTVTLVLTSPGLAYAQALPPATPSLADVARAEEARRKTAKKATKVFTNNNLAAPDNPPPPPSMAAPAGSTTTSPDAASETISGGVAEPEDPSAKRDQKYWQDRITSARADLERTKLFAESMQTRANSLEDDIFNLDYPARGVAEKQRATALAELQRLRQEIEAKTKAIAAIEDEARRANVPAGWLRPPA